MIESFFSATRKIDPQPQPISTSDSIILLSGPRSCGKTSLLFQFALNSVLEMSSSSNDYVVFICSRSRLENNPLISPRYVDDDEGMKKYFAAFHLHEMSPKAVIVDDFGDFFDDSEKLDSGNSCKLLISDTYQGDTPRSLFIYKRWASSIFTIKGNGQGSYLLSSSSSSELKKVAKYSIALQYLVLEEITVEDN
ncbi:hypothetical protein Scep_018316 [Stephania cephalantha]|uniref:ATPase n=1 Tax=Stephania cephalantha TaxID=152367 RepID=A0AAP0IR67_9MAGN